MSKNLVWHNKNWQNSDAINISIQDRAIRFSDGIFETILIKKYGHLMHEESPEIIYNHIKSFLLSKNYNLCE